MCVYWIRSRELYVHVVDALESRYVIVVDTLESRYVHVEDALESWYMRVQATPRLTLLMDPGCLPC